MVWEINDILPVSQSYWGSMFDVTNVVHFQNLPIVMPYLFTTPWTFERTPFAGKYITVTKYQDTKTVIYFVSIFIQIFSIYIKNFKCATNILDIFYGEIIVNL